MRGPAAGSSQRAAPGDGAVATTLQKRTLWKSVISAVSWPWGPASVERRHYQTRATASLPPPGPGHPPLSDITPPGAKQIPSLDGLL